MIAARCAASREALWWLWYSRPIEKICIVPPLAVLEANGLRGSHKAGIYVIQMPMQFPLVQRIRVRIASLPTPTLVVIIQETAVCWRG